MTGPETAIDNDSYSYNVLVPGETSVRLGSGGLVMSDRSRAVEYDTASAGARQTAGRQR